MTLLEHPLWPELRPYFHADAYVREGGGSKNPRVRIEVRDLPEPLRTKALAIEVSCVRCGAGVHPIRERLGPAGRPVAGGLYYAPSCPLNVNVGCSRGVAARDDYVRMKNAL